jgi:hypothetical protein
MDNKSKRLPAVVATNVLHAVSKIPLTIAPAKTLKHKKLFQGGRHAGAVQKRN